MSGTIIITLRLWFDLRLLYIGDRKLFFYCLSTSIGNGIALPHAKLPSDCAELNQPIALFFKLEQSIDYEASDNKEVDLVYAMMFPESCCEKYKGCLQQIAQKLSDKALAKQLRTAQSADEIWQILAYIDRQSETEE